MNTALLILTILIFAASCVGMLLLFRRMVERLVRLETGQRAQTGREVDMEIKMVDEFHKLDERLNEFIRNTDYDFRAVKTRLADEERQDQNDKRRSRDAVRREQK